MAEQEVLDSCVNTIAVSIRPPPPSPEHFVPPLAFVTLNITLIIYTN